MKALCQLCCISAILGSSVAFGEGEQQFSDLGDLRLQSGQTLKNCRVGYRTFGTLNADKSNAVLVPTWFMGRSGDLAGSFKAGGLVDSAKYYVIAVDALGNGVSSSPSTSKEQPEGAFPAIGIRDMVESQHALLLRLGIGHLRAVLGISMGGMQTFQWITAYPDFLDKAVPIVGSPRPSSYDLMFYGAGLKTLREAIRDSAARKPLVCAFADTFMLALHTPSYYARTTERKGAVEGLTGFEKSVLAMDIYDVACDLRAISELNCFQPFNDDEATAGSAVKAKVFVISASQDHCVNPGPALSFAKALSAQLMVLDNDSGHQSPGDEMAKISPAISAFLEG